MAAREKTEDRISKLPDSILAIHILSRLPTLDTVRTCILSKRWIHLWTQITNLNFDDYDYDNLLNHNTESRDFPNFVSMVLLRLATSSIESFSLSTTCTVDTFFFRNSWFPALAYRRIRNLRFSYMNCDVDNALISSRYIFSCHSLVELSLHLEGCVVTIPNYIHLPNLHILHLYHTQFSPETSSNSQEIILSFPVLKKLESYDSFWSDMRSVRFEVPLLEMVEIDEIDYVDHGAINLCTSQLTYFSFHGHPSNCYNILSKLPSDVNSSVRITFCELDGSEEERKQWGIQACILLKQLNMYLVKHLDLSSTKDFSFAKESFADLPTFNMLHHLKLYSVSDDMLVEFLLKSPYLTSLTIMMEHLNSCSESKSEVEHCKNDHAKQLLEFGIVPDCIHNTLKTFKMLEFCGHQSELSLAKYMMENAEQLEILSFSCRRLPKLHGNKRKMEQIKEKILSWKRGSNLTIIDFAGQFYTGKL